MLLGAIRCYLVLLGAIRDNRYLCIDLPICIRDLFPELPLICKAVRRVRTRPCVAMATRVGTPHWLPPLPCRHPPEFKHNVQRNVKQSFSDRNIGRFGCSLSRSSAARSTC